jgi:glycosyltransferase involved in cell wall biosynthesis
VRKARRGQFYGLFDAMIAYSRRGAAEYVEMGFSPERVFVAPNAVAFRPKSAPPPRPFSEAGRSRLLFVGRLQARKRIDHLLLACAALPDALQPELQIVGDGPARGELEELASTLYPRAEFHGERRGSELEPIFAWADLFVLPGTGGLAVQQAMAHGLPVIVAEGDGTQDDLVRPENGWRVPAGDIQALADTLGQALASRARLRQMGEASYRLVVEEINVEKMVEAFLSAFRAVSPVQGQV